MPLVEQRRHAIGLADLLLYDSLIEDGVLLQQDGGLLAAWKFQGPDLGSATNGEMAALSGRLGALLPGIPNIKSSRTRLQRSSTMSVASSSCPRARISKAITICR